MKFTLTPYINFGSSSAASTKFAAFRQTHSYIQNDLYGFLATPSPERDEFLSSFSSQLTTTADFIFNTLS